MPRASLTRCGSRFLCSMASFESGRASRAFYETFGVSKEETEGQFIYDLGNGQWNIPALRTLLEEILPLEKSMKDFEVEHEFPSLGLRVMQLNARKLWREGNHTELVLLAIEDITERKRLSEELVRSNEDMQRFAYVAAHDLRAPAEWSAEALEASRQAFSGPGRRGRGTSACTLG